MTAFRTNVAYRKPRGKSVRRSGGPYRRKSAPLVATDSEWDDSLQQTPHGKWISTAFAWGGRCVIFIRDDVPDEIRQRLDARARELKVEVRYVSRDDSTNLVKLLGIKGRVPLVIFYSPKDVEFALGWKLFEDAILKGTVRQRNNLSGRIGNIQIRDLSGLAGKRKLIEFARGLGVPMSNKENLDAYKKCMWKGLLERPEDFLAYAADDARLLLTLHDTFVERFRTVQKECLGMADEADLWSARDLPMTQGTLVAKTFERWLFTHAGEHRDALRFGLCKLGLLDPDAKDYATSKDAYEHAVNHYHDLDSLRQGLRHSDPKLTTFLRASYMFTALDSGSIRWWTSRPVTETAPYNALVHGGRCLNENPYEYHLGPGFDVDISGCYGDGLRKLKFPVGLPTVWTYTSNERRPTLGHWLDTWEHELVPGLWMCVVSGPLVFEQDLIYSKLVKARSIGRLADDTSAEFVMLRKEIHNGVLTADVLQCLRSVATTSEWASLRKLEVVTAAAYLKSDRVSDVREWSEVVLADCGTYGGRRYSRVAAGKGVDNRTRAWYEIPLELFIGKLVDERKRFKKMAKDESVSEEERTQAKALDGMLKLLVNTVYGVLASPHFAVGNTIVANNITARARVGVWQVAKALGLRQCITDGGIYTPDRVCAFRGRKPGLDTLSRPWDWYQSKHGRYYCAMGGRSWAGEPTSPSVMDQLAMEHVHTFWAAYGLPFPFQLEHKTEHSFTRAAYWSKSDYALQTTKGVVFALRGKDKTKRDDWKAHPSFAMLRSILDGRDDFPTDLTYTKGGILKVGKYNVAQASNGYETLKGFRPGDNLPVETFDARYNNTHFPLSDQRDYLRRRNRKKMSRGKPSRWFERYAPSISAVHRAMANNDLRLN
jgi:hypothetical protein